MLLSAHGEKHENCFHFSALGFLSFIPLQTPSIPSLRVDTRALRREESEALRDELVTEANL